MAKNRKKKTYSGFVNNSVDFILLITVLMLLCFGLIMVLSASAPKALAEKQTSYYFFIRQLIFAVLGVAAMLVISKIDYRFYRRFYKIVWVISILLLIAVIFFGRTVNNAKRWIYITDVLSFQPSEIVKFLLIIFYAGILTKNRDDLDNFWLGLVKHLCFVVPIIVLLLLQPHFSASIIIMGTCFIMMVMAGCRLWQFIISGVMVGAPALIYLVIKAPYRLQRVVTFMDPWKDQKGAGWQVIQSLYAIGSGGLFGCGLGAGKQKYLYLPEPHNDFIFSVVAEELGFFGCLVVVVLFGLLIWRGITVAMKCPDMFGSLMAIGITALIGLQVVINIAVVTSSMPATGMPLPFFSYGGTALFILLCEMGVLLNISRNTSEK